ncbi:rhomboid family intramembrane serine protease [Stenomitos frigidus]|uniref:Rhomboid family intramembrane serine protease n=1 Tax=Stenomitos frigidus ULC18 TaxID=2107698 RepID=A0A2T1E2J8_9CYAN|nr:rhomboid family intramembrane serine protease [Stenomitos frigidus]PSB26965.1 rhomboid family intramembrane serine protease [Stenomitos frigidus ULC18]
MISDFFLQSRLLTSGLVLAFFALCLVLKADFWLLFPALALPVVLTWLLWLLSTLFFGGAFNQLGVRPRQLNGVWGILLAPVLHNHARADEAQHLVGNTVAFLSFGGFIVMPRGLADFLLITAVVALSSGCFTWLCGREGSNHIGASGILYGYFGFLLLRGFYEHQVAAILLSMLMMAFYSPLLLGIFPQNERISWEMHFGGFVGGLATACYFNTIQANAKSLLPTFLP